MNKEDPGNVHWWNLLQRFRNYAASLNGVPLPCLDPTILYRGVVLCDAHTHGLYLNSTNQLLFDFHAAPLRIKDYGPNWGTGNGGGAIIEEGYVGAIYNDSKGGLTYMGWETDALPYKVEFDNYGYCCNSGPMVDTGGLDYYPWGWDEITWFALQSETYRNDWLKYVYYKVKCIDPKGHVEMPGRRGMTEPTVPWPGNLYRAASTSHNQQPTIKAIWNGDFDEMDWLYHNFTDEEVSSPPSSPHVASNLVFAGNDKMFYISNDNRIHGYVKYNGDWVTVSPSWSAHIYNGQNISSQQPATTSLAVNESGTKLYYKGTDGFMYGYNINTLWNYTHFTMPKTPLMTQNLRIESDIVCVGDNTIYYIGNELGNSNAKRIHTYVKYLGNWTTTSPTWVAHGNGQNVSTQTQAAGDLVVDPQKQNLYYRGISGFMHGYSINSIWDYDFFNMPISPLISQGVRVFDDIAIADNDMIFYVGRESNKGALRIHGFVKNGGSWTTVSPSWSAHMYNGQHINTQKKANAELTVTPDGQKIFYQGNDMQLYGFDINSKWNYEYFDIEDDIPALSWITNSLQAPENDEVFYVSNFFNLVDKKVHCYKFENNYCGNEQILVIEPTFSESGISPGSTTIGGNNGPGKPTGTLAPGKPTWAEVSPVKPAISQPTGGTTNGGGKPNQQGGDKKGDDESFSQMENTFKLYPNPADGIVNIKLNTNAYFEKLTIYDVSGRLVYSKDLSYNQYGLKLDCSHWAKGIYYVQLQGGTANPVLEKLIVN